MTPQRGTASGVDLIRPGRFAGPAARAVYTTRSGGTSSGAYASLNMGFHVGDTKASVIENRQRVAAELGLVAEDFACGIQSHSDGVAVVTEAGRGRGARAWEEGFASTDALVTDVPGVPLAVVAADCLLVALADAASGAVAAVHASRRSALAGVVGRTVAAMCERFGADPAGMVAVMGPHICERCYEVGPDVEAEAARARGPAAAEFFTGRSGGGRSRFRLGHLVRSDLLAAGVLSGSIEETGGCTACEPERFYSYRRDGAKTGRNALIVWKSTGEVARHG